MTNKPADPDFLLEATLEVLARLDFSEAGGVGSRIPWVFILQPCGSYLYSGLLMGIVPLMFFASCFK